MKKKLADKIIERFLSKEEMEMFKQMIRYGNIIMIPLGYVKYDSLLIGLKKIIIIHIMNISLIYNFNNTLHLAYEYSKSEIWKV